MQQREERISEAQWEQFLRDNSDGNYEFWGGHVFAMATGGYLHSRLMARLGGLLEFGMEDKPCSPTGSEFYVKIESTGDWLIPDNAIHCEDARWGGEPRRFLLNPVVVFEVLSPSTELKDRGTKFELYSSIASLQEYLLISATRVGIEQFSRRDAGWLLTRHTSLDSVIELPSVDFQLSLAELYRGLGIPVQLTLVPPTPEIIL